MPTRFYFQPYQDWPAGVATTVASIWDTVGFDAFGKLTPSLQGTAPPVVLTAQNKASAANPYNVMIGRFISDPLAAGTITVPSAVQLVIPLRGISVAGGDQAMLQFAARIVTSTGTTRHTLLSGQSLTTVVTTGETSYNRALHQTLLSTRKYQGNITSAASIQQGDRLQVEIGVRWVTATTNLPAYAAFTAAETANDDLPFKANVTYELGTNSYLFLRPWIEFVDNIKVAGTLNEGEVRFTDNGIVLNGPATLPFTDITRIDGIDAAPVPANISNRAGAHGGYVTSTFEGPRTITIEGDFYADPATFYSDLQALRNCFAPSAVPRPLRVQTDQGTMLFFGKSQGLRATVDRQRSYGKLPFQVQIVCQDPRRYTDAVTRITLPASNTLFTIGGDRDTTGIIKIKNNSNGSLSNPYTLVIQNSYSGLAQLQLNTSLAAGDELVYNLDERSAILNGTTNIRNFVTFFGTRWPVISAGNNYMFNAAAGGVATLDYRPAWW